jgi:hypothetical protein
VLCDEQQQVALRHAAVRVHMGLQRQGRIQHRVHGRLAVQLRRALHQPGVGGAAFQDAAAARFRKTVQQRIAAAKVGVAQHMGTDQRIFSLGVAVRQEGAAWRAGKHHFINAGLAHMARRHLAQVAQAEGPVAHAHRQTIDGDFEHEAFRHPLEIHRSALQAQFGGQRLHGGQMAAHARPAPWQKKLRMASHASSGCASVQIAAAPPACRRALNRRRSSLSWAAAGRDAPTAVST